MEHEKASCDSHIVTKHDIGHITKSQSQHVIRKTHNGNNIRTIRGYCTAIIVKYISNVQNQIETLLSSPC